MKYRGYAFWSEWRGWWFASVFMLLLLVIGGGVLRTLLLAGVFREVVPHYSGYCSRVDGLHGPEDITVHPKTGVALVSDHDLRAFRAGNKTRGDVFSIDFNQNPPVKKNLTSGFSVDFHPHGLSLYIDEDGEEFLFVINHTGSGDFVEIFQYVDEVMEHRHSIKSPLMFSANDVVGVGPASFYVTNDHGSTTPLGKLLEEFFSQKWSYVLFYDGTNMRVAADGIGIANGINISPGAGTSLYVASFTYGTVSVYSRDVVTGALEYQFEMDVGSSVDNLEVAEDGAIYAAGRPKVFDSLSHNKDPNHMSPSQVLKIELMGGEKYEVSELYLNDGSEISSATVAAPFADGFLVGQAKGHHLLICREKLNDA